MKRAGTLAFVLGGVFVIASIIALIERSNRPVVCIGLAINGAGLLIAGAMLLKR